MRRIETLNENQVFVFGSNENGYHAGGYALYVFYDTRRCQYSSLCGA